MGTSDSRECLTSSRCIMCAASFQRAANEETPCRGTVACILHSSTSVYVYTYISQSGPECNMMCCMFRNDHWMLNEWLA